MKLAIVKLRGLLSLGTRFTAEFIGVNSTLCPPGMELTRRTVVKNTTHALVSRMEDGPRAGEEIHLNWKGLTADQDGREITLTNTNVDDDPGTFLKIIIDT